MSSVNLKKEAKKELKRRKIIESATYLFSRNNYHEVMIDEVARMSDIAKGTVYNYFSSKEELYFSIMRMRMEKLIGSLDEKIRTEMSSIDSLHSFVVHLYMFMMKYQNFFLMYRKESMKGENEICSNLVHLDNELKKMLKGIISAGKTENFFRDIEDDFAADLILGSIYGAVARGIERNFSEELMRSDRERIYDFVLHGLFSGFDNENVLPLKGKTIVITRTIEQSKESSDVFNQLGAHVIIFPTLDIVPPESWNQFDKVVTKNDNIDFIIFTSAHAVRMFSDRCDELGIKINYEKIKVVAVGNKTASVCEKFEIPVDIIPRHFSGEGVIAELSNFDLDGKVIFIPRSAIGREELPKELEKHGAIIKAAPVYNVAIPSEEKIKVYKERLEDSHPDLFIFTSPSTFKNFLEIMEIKDPVEYFNGFDVAAIGPTTKLELERYNINVTVMPDEYTIEGLSKSIINHYKKNLPLNN